MSNTVEKSIEVHVPARTAYDQWTQFETFPQFMEGVEEVEQIDDRHLRWKAKFAGAEREWRAEITEQIPDKRIAWRSTDGPTHAGVVTFHRLSDDTSRVMVQMEYEPASFTEKLGAAFNRPEKRVEEGLEGFKRFLEERGTETGAWRGEIPSKDDRGGV